MAATIAARSPRPLRGVGTFDAFPVGGNVWLGLGQPVYRDGPVPSTVEARRALAVLLSGLAISVLLGALVFVLATGRARALRMVALRTEELHHLAMHDALTGLPNRSLIYDRVSHALARARRIRIALARPVWLSGVGADVTVGTSIGIAVGTHGGVEDLLREADIAVYEAKRAGKDRYVLFAGT